MRVRLLAGINNLREGISKENGMKLISTDQFPEPEKIELVLWHRCNSPCVFCSAGGSSGNEFSVESACLALETFRNRGVKAVSLGGGEPSVFKHLHEIISAAKKLGYETIEIKSNGIRFCYPDFVTECLESGINLFTISMWGGNPQIHDRLAGLNGAFEMTEMGLKHLVHYKTDVKVDFLISNLSLNSFEEGFANLEKIGIQKIDVWLFSIFGAGGLHSDLLPGIGKVGETVIKALKTSRSGRMRIRTSHIPPCFLKGAEELYYNVRELKLMIVTPGGHSFMAEESPFESGVRVPACEKCGFRDRCPGPRKEYIDLFGDSEFIIDSSIGR
jgi:MoaA/NifB/PqqE/SkfB family radical SAM enzyme